MEHGRLVPTRAGHRGGRVTLGAPRVWLPRGTQVDTWHGPGSFVHILTASGWALPNPRGAPRPLPQQWQAGPTHFIFSARCSVFSRMAWDSWDTGFSIRLSKITCKGPRRQLSPRSPASPPRPRRGGAPASSRFRGRVLLARGSSQRSFMFWSRSRELKEPGGTFWKLRLASGMR